MSQDVVVTLPLSFGLDRWVEEGDPAGEAWSGTEWGFYLGGSPARVRFCQPGDRVYVVFNRKLRGYAPLLRVERTASGYALVRGGGAVAVTIPSDIIGFRGPRYRWWDRALEVPFPDWRKP